MIEIVNLKKVKNKKVLLNNINLKLEDKNIYNILGENGSSKTVLLKVITNIWQATEGKIICDGEDIIKTKSFIKNFAIYNEEMSIDLNETVINNIKFINKNIKEDVIDKYLDAFNLSKEKNTKCNELSKGMLQKIKLIIIFAKDAKYIFLDEPFKSLDNNSQEILKNVILYMKEKGKTICITTHIKKYIDFADYKIFLENGEIKKYE